MEIGTEPYVIYMYADCMEREGVRWVGIEMGRR